MKWITKCTRIVLLNMGPAMQGQLYHVVSSTVTSGKSQKKSETMLVRIYEYFPIYSLSFQ